jgi:hypothetical protein
MRKQAWFEIYYSKQFWSQFRFASKDMHGFKMCTLKSLIIVHNTQNWRYCFGDEFLPKFRGWKCIKKNSAVMELCKIDPWSTTSCRCRPGRWCWLMPREPTFSCKRWWRSRWRPGFKFVNQFHNSWTKPKQVKIKLWPFIAL